MKTESLYIPFRFELPALAFGRPIYEGQDGLLLAFQDYQKAYQRYEQLQQMEGAQLSAFGCGLQESQHIHLPNCAGILRLKVPQNTITSETQVVLMNPDKPHNHDDVVIQPEWIRQINLYISGDIMHGPMSYTQITQGAPLLDDIAKQAYLRYADLATVCTKIASDTKEQRRAADLQGEFVRDALQEMYSSNGFAHKRFRVRPNETQSEAALRYGMEYAQTYMKALDSHLGIDSVLRYAHLLEQDFRETFDATTKNVRQASAAAMAQVLQAYVNKATTPNEQIVLRTLCANANQDAQLSEQAQTKHEDTQTIEEPEEIL